MTSSPHGPLQGGLHTCYNGDYRGLILKSRLSSDCPLQLEGMKLESLVIADQHAAVNTFPGPCTHRPSHHGSWFYPKAMR